MASWCKVCILSNRLAHTAIHTELHDSTTISQQQALRKGCLGNIRMILLLLGKAFNPGCWDRVWDFVVQQQNCIKNPSNAACPVQLNCTRQFGLQQGSLLALHSFAGRSYKCSCHYMSFQSREECYWTSKKHGFMWDVLVVQPVGTPASAKVPQVHELGIQNQASDRQRFFQGFSLLWNMVLQRNPKHLLVLEKCGILNLFCIPQD